MNAYLCPVCHQGVKPTRGRNIPAHLDTTLAATCPGGGHPFHITIAATIELVTA